MKMLLTRADYFALDADDALAILAEVQVKVSGWRGHALSPEVGLRPSELDDFAPAVAHEQMAASGRR